ncbi:MAG TPA: phosphatidate cytidylyltransferase [Thermoanaerobaculia bacterium]|nr:phosphatidate cytidylyltransferase [Thermoanaerobaculia bacterium]
MSEAAAVPRRKNFTRELTSIAGAPILIWLVGWAPPLAYVLTIAILAALVLYELLDLGEKKGYPVQKPLSIALLFLLLGGFVLEAISVEPVIVATMLIIPAWYVFARTDLEEALPASAVSILGVLYVGMLAGALLRLRLEFGEQGPKLVFFLFLVVWAGDAGAYYVGRNFGRRPLSHRVSPKKTIEGTVGGIAVSILAAAAIQRTFFPEFPLLHALLAAGILSASGVVGDLVESMWKRSAAVKDSGTSLPGHGGFLDRSDSILFTAPILYFYWTLLVRAGGPV